MRQSRQGKHTDPDVREAIKDLGLAGNNAKRIVDILDARPEFEGRVPRERAVRGVLAEGASDRSDDWKLEDSYGTDLRAVLDSLAAVVRVSGGRKTFLTTEEAQWVIRIAEAAPELNPWLRFKLATMYLSRRAAAHTTIDFDVFLAFGPWRGGEHAASYLHGAGRAFPPPPWSIDEQGAALPTFADRLAAEAAVQPRRTTTPAIQPDTESDKPNG